MTRLWLACVLALVAMPVVGQQPAPWTRAKTCKAENGRFRQPTDVTWDRAGDIYLSDGYVNASN